MATGLFNACTSNTEKFSNTFADDRIRSGNIFEIAKAYIRAERTAPIPAAPLPLRQIPAAELAARDGEAVVYRLGHSTLLMRLDGDYVLTDPVFSERASPVQWMGPKRFHPLPFELDELPGIKAVVISHDHYDHLDRASVLALDGRVERFIVPLKVGNHLRRWGIAADKIVELDWWQSVSVGSLKFTATPAQHFSGRGLMDRDQTLWASWVIESHEARVFFSGDSGYFDGFREIGERFGHFDLTLIETGAYNHLWSQVHMLPEQSVQAHIDLRGRVMLPIHNSTFDLALHDWYEPLERAAIAAEQYDVRLATPIIGAPLKLGAPGETPAWWREGVARDASLAITES
ncbi:MBL fold metallo-hydrolase [Microbulbifer taiwanensis]|uniref:MBL fold metallo-hydrolase n=1 Tax=Microbulbifer taiwanensis TaxID=986746 RepID=A0ABW1YM27_9GAMM|nr:MBL fold metallo-hydrolase [Microbulbifer taiwanensis]